MLISVLTVQSSAVTYASGDGWPNNEVNVRTAGRRCTFTSSLIVVGSKKYDKYNF